MPGQDRLESSGPNDSDRTRRVVPVVAERLRVGRRKTVTGRVRVSKRLRSSTVVVDEPVVREEVTVRRVAVGRFVDGPVPDRYEDGALVVSVVEEVPVVVRRFRLVEELRIRRRRLTVPRRQPVTLRREEADVRREPDGARGRRPNLKNVTRSGASRT